MLEADKSAPATTTPSSSLAPGENARLAAAVEAIRNRPAEAHTVSRLAKLAGMSRSHFAESFRNCYGRSPMEFLRTTRLSHASNLLLTTSMAIKLIGASVGYDSRTAFANAFRRAYGLSPADYRASHAPAEPTDIHAVSERLREWKGSAQEVAWEVNLSNGAVWWSEGTFAALGYDTRKRLIADVARFYERIHPEDRARVVQSADEACRSDRLTWDAVFRFSRADGSYVKISNGCVILRDRGGVAVRLIGVMRLAGYR